MTSDSVEFSYYLGVLRRRWWIVLAGAVLGVLMVQLLTPSTPGKFRATSEVLVRSFTDEPLRAAREEQLVNLSTETKIATSREVAELAAATPGVSTPVDDLVAGLSVNAIANTEVLQFRFDDNVAQVAMVNVQALADAYLDYRVSAPTRALEFEITVLTDELTAATESLASANLVLAQQDAYVAYDIAVAVEERRARDEGQRLTELAIANRGSRAEDVQPIVVEPALIEPPPFTRPSPEDLANAATEREVAASQATILSTQINSAESTVVDGGEVVSQATLPESRRGVSSLMPLLAGGLVGLLLFVGVAFMFDRTLDRVYNAKDIESETGSPVLAHLRGEAVRVGNPVMRTNPNSDEAHSYRRLAAAVLSAEVDSAGQNKLVVASADQTPAHAMVSTNLALALEEAGKHVVLVAGDRQRNDIDAIFTVEDRDGLQQVLDGTNEVGFVAVSPKLRVLPSGRVDSFNFLNEDADVDTESGVETSNLVPSVARIETLLEAASNWADIVIIDVPPALSYADAQIFAALSDTVVLSATAGRTTLGELGELKSMMTLAGASILGSVLLEKSELRPAKASA